MPPEQQTHDSDNESEASHNPGYDLFESDLESDTVSAASNIVLSSSDSEEETNAKQ